MAGLPVVSPGGCEGLFEDGERSSPVGWCFNFRPSLDFVDRPGSPGELCLGVFPEQPVDDGVDVDAFGEGVFVFEVALEDLREFLLSGFDLSLKPLEIREQVVFGAEGSEEQLDQRFGFEAGAGGGLSKPALERVSSFRCDRVDRAAAPTDRLRAGLRKPSFDEPLCFGVQIALGSRPDVVEAAPHLLCQLVGWPGLNREQPEDRVRGRRQFTLRV